MSFSFSVLGSGSSGNCTLLLFHDGDGTNRRCALIDVGLSPRRTAQHLAEHNLTIADVSAILLTHLDIDHFCPGWLKVIERFDIPVHAHHRHRSITYRVGIPVKRTCLFTDELTLLDRASIECMMFAHDVHGSAGFVIEHGGKRLGFATDLGRVPEFLYERFVDLHSLAIESNYDRRMQLESGRPAFLKKRIMGGMGHLSNEQSLEAVHRIESQSHLSTIALLHLSRQCNDPKVVQSLYMKKAPHLIDRLKLTSQFEPTPLIEVKPGVRRSKSPTLAGRTQVQELLFSGRAKG